MGAAAGIDAGAAVGSVTERVATAGEAGESISNAVSNAPGAMAMVAKRLKPMTVCFQKCARAASADSAAYQRGTAAGFVNDRLSRSMSYRQ